MGNEIPYLDDPAPVGTFRYVIETVDAAGEVIASHECDDVDSQSYYGPAGRLRRGVWESSDVQFGPACSGPRPVRGEVPAPRWIGGQGFRDAEILALAGCADAGSNAFFSDQIWASGSGVNRGYYSFDTCLRLNEIDASSPMQGMCVNNDFLLALCESSQAVTVVGGVLYVVHKHGDRLVLSGIPRADVMREVLDTCGPAGIALVATLVPNGFLRTRIRFSRGKTAEVGIPRRSLSHLSAAEHRSILEAAIVVAEMVER